MLPITGQIYSPYQVHSGTGKRRSFKWNFEHATVAQVRESEGFPIPSYRALVDMVAEVTTNNKLYEMFYRGQNKDYRDKKNRTFVYPSICRPDRNPDGTMKASIFPSTIERRFEEAYAFMKFYDKTKKEWDEHNFSYFQHYEIFPTPLIDITQSLRVAATFALMGSNQPKLLKEGYLYVFGLPYPNGSISHFIDQGIVLIKLQNAVDKDYLRPRYQEGYLVGKLPIRRTKEAGDNLGRRLIAKFKLLNDRNKFWDKSFPPMPHNVLYPKPDMGESLLRSAFSDFQNKL